MILFSIVDDLLQNKLHMIGQDMIKLKNERLIKRSEREDEKISMKIKHSIYDEMLVLVKIREFM